MKRLIFNALLVTAACTAYGQDSPKQNSPKSELGANEVTKHTVMERFEPQFILSATERLKLKEERIAEIERQRQILDTIDISERRRQKLLRDLLKDPYSARLSRTLAEIEFEDENDQ